MIRKANKEDFVEICKICTEDLGFVHVEKYNTLYYKKMANNQGLAVARKYRKKGYGKRLMEAPENWTRENHIDLVRLNSGSTRKEAHEFYRNIGYDNEKLQVRFMKEL